ncbi:MAG: Nramp family divalent metal transporter [Acidobacteria bacterium]|nr:Nramp family divalent metal transporter [Acidobacteriota bacterium]
MSEDKRHRVKEFFKDLGPGLITGAADDDPSGISTYSIAGAQFGFSTLWTALLSFPLMAVVQLMCARLGIVSGRGLASLIRTTYPRWVLFMACFLLIVANVFNIGADLAGMGEVSEMLSGVSRYVWTPIFAILIVALLIFATYRQIVSVFKWLTLVLFAYVITAFLVKPDWSTVLYSTFVPHIEWTPAYIAVFVGLMGTTISPYLFFWQASQEVEEEKAKDKVAPEERENTTRTELRKARIDVVTGMFMSNLVMFFIILTTATTLHLAGKSDVASAREAAEALRPLAGDLCYAVFSLGIIGTGMLGVPVLAGSAAYAVSEAENFRGSLEDKPDVSRRFYGVITLAVLVGLMLVFLGVNPTKMLFYSAILNGVLAPPLIVLVILLNGNKDIMGDNVASPFMKVVGWFTAALMSAAAIAMFVTM